MLKFSSVRELLSIGVLFLLCTVHYLTRLSTQKMNLCSSFDLSSLERPPGTGLLEVPISMHREESFELIPLSDSAH